MTTLHALEQARDRIGAELTENEVQGIVRNADRIAGEVKVDTGARVYRLGRMVGHAWSDTSNGDTVIAIIRRGPDGTFAVVTFMFRRSTQPHTPEAYGVQAVRG